MIAYVSGTLAEKHPTRVVLDVQGVGYEIFIPLSSYDSLPPAGESCRLLVHDHVREDAHQLYGFMTAGEKEMFLALIGVSGIGPKLALSALSGMSVRELTAAVVDGDVKRLSSISGLGKKTAERIVVDLRDKFGGMAEDRDWLPSAEAGGDSRVNDAMLALVALGHKPGPARKQVMAALRASGDEATVEELIKKSLSGS
jgi:Holliday junction DNA helicase RuvA